MRISDWSSGVCSSDLYVWGGGGGARKAVLFLVFAGVGLVINVTATTLIWQASDLPLILCKTGGVGIAFLFNFAVNYLIVFRSRPAHRINAMLLFSHKLSTHRCGLFPLFLPNGAALLQKS